MGPQHRDRVRRGERRPAGEQFVEHDPGAVQVGGGARRGVLGQLRCHVHGRADRTAEPGHGRPVGEPGDTEVGQHRPRAAGAGGVDHDVRRLDVAMDDTGFVDDGQGGQYLADQLDRLGIGQAAMLAEIPAQVDPVDEVHDDREGVALGHDVADLHQVRVVEGEQHPALAQEPVDDLRVVGQLGPQHLHGNQPMVTGTVVDPFASPDLAAGTPSEGFVQDVPGTQSPHRP